MPSRWIFSGRIVTVIAAVALTFGLSACSQTMGSSTAALTVYTMAKSKRLSDFLDVLSDERLGWGQKLRALREVWR